MATKRYVTGGMGSRPGFGATSIGGGGLTDVDITNPQPEDVLTYDGGDWVNRPLSWKEPVLTLFNPTTALPPSPTNGDRYISTATANGWTVNHIYTYNGLTGTANAAVTSTNTTLKDTRLSMTADEYVGMVITCNGKTMTVTSNNGNTFTGASWSGGGNPGNGNSWAGVLWTDIAPVAGMMIWATVLRQLYEYDNTAFYWRPFPDTYLKPVISIYDNTTALPVTPLPGDRYIAMTTANGWQKDYVYEWDNVTGNGWVELYPLEGSMIFISELGNFFVYDNGAWMQYPVTWQDPVISIFDNTSALPVAPTDGDRYIAKITANGWTIDYIYEWNSLNWVGTAPVIGMFVFNNNTGAPYLYTGAAWVIFNPLTAHAFGGALHTADTIANIKTKVSDGSLITSAAGEIAATTEKTVPVYADVLLIEDSAATNAKKRVQIANLVPWLYGTGAPPSAAGYREGTLYFKYIP